MTMTVRPALFELRSGEAWRDPFPMYRGLRDHDPVHHVVDGDFWFLYGMLLIMTKMGQQSENGLMG